MKNMVSNVKNTPCQECGKGENHCTPVKLRSKIQAMKVPIKQEDGRKFSADAMDKPCPSY